MKKAKRRDHYIPQGLQEAIRHPDTLIVVPLCWQACLFGSLRRFDVETDRLNVEDMRTS
jgi:hypothetical protein